MNSAPQGSCGEQYIMISLSSLWYYICRPPQVPVRDAEHTAEQCTENDKYNPHYNPHYSSTMAMNNNNIDDIDEDNLIKHINLPIRPSKKPPLKGKNVNSSNLSTVNTKRHIIDLPIIDKDTKTESAVIGYFGDDKRGRIRIIRPKMPIPKDVTIIELASKYYPLSWHHVFTNSQEELKLINEKLLAMRRRDILPRLRDVFNAFKLTNFDDVKVIIIGQDPYFLIDETTGKPNACGVSFGTRRGVAVQASLRQIYKEIHDEYKGTDMEFKIPTHGDITPWAKQGVLMLNMALTTEVNQPNAHKVEWKMFLNKVIKAISRRHDKLIFVLWGGEAKNVKDLAVGSHDFLMCAHPVARQTKEPFLGCGHFVEINRLLLKNKKSPIDWRLPA